MTKTQQNAILAQKEQLALYENAIKEKCFDCMCHYDDGRFDCEVPKCSLYAFMPYKGKKAKCDGEL